MFTTSALTASCYNMFDQAVDCEIVQIQHENIVNFDREQTAEKTTRIENNE